METRMRQWIQIICFKKPFNKPCTVFFKFKKEFLFMAPVGNVPHVSWHEIAVCSGYFLKLMILGLKWYFKMVMVGDLSCFY